MRPNSGVLSTSAATNASTESNLARPAWVRVGRDAKAGRIDETGEPRQVAAGEVRAQEGRGLRAGVARRHLDEGPVGGLIGQARGHDDGRDAVGRGDASHLAKRPGAVGKNISAIWHSTRSNDAGGNGRASASPWRQSRSGRTRRATASMASFRSTPTTRPAPARDPLSEGLVGLGAGPGLPVQRVVLAPIARPRVEDVDHGPSSGASSGIVRSSTRFSGETSTCVAVRRAALHDCPSGPLSVTHAHAEVAVELGPEAGGEEAVAEQPPRSVQDEHLELRLGDREAMRPRWTPRASRRRCRGPRCCPPGCRRDDRGSR